MSLDARLAHPSSRTADDGRPELVGFELGIRGDGVHVAGFAAAGSHSLAVQWVEDEPSALSVTYNALTRLRDDSGTSPRAVAVCTWGGGCVHFPFLDSRLRAVAAQAGIDPAGSVPWRMLPDDRESPVVLPGHIGGYRVDFPGANRLYHVDLAQTFRPWCEAHGIPWRLDACAAELGHPPAPTPDGRTGMVANLGHYAQTYREMALHAWRAGDLDFDPKLP